MQGIASAFADAVVLVTGGSRGLGESICRLFHGAGAAVLIADVRDEQGSALAATLGSRAAYVGLDVTQERQWQVALKSCVEQFGHPTILINNAGIYRQCPLEQITAVDYQQIMDVNALGTFLGMKTVTAGMRRMRAGAIVNVASTAGLEGIGGVLAYVASKHAVIGMTKAAAIEMAVHGIRVNAVCPGPMATPLLSEGYAVPAETLLAMEMPLVPMGRMAHADEVARLVLYVASTDASYSTGGVFVADGGLTAGLRTG